MPVEKLASLFNIQDSRRSAAFHSRPLPPQSSYRTLQKHNKKPSLTKTNSHNQSFLNRLAMGTSTRHHSTTLQHGFSMPMKQTAAVLPNRRFEDLSNAEKRSQLENFGSKKNFSGESVSTKNRFAVGRGGVMSQQQSFDGRGGQHGSKQNLRLERLAKMNDILAEEIENSPEARHDGIQPFGYRARRGNLEV